METLISAFIAILRAAILTRTSLAPENGLGRQERRLKRLSPLAITGKDGSPTAAAATGSRKAIPLEIVVPAESKYPPTKRPAP